MKYSDLRGKRVTVMGLGLHGGGVGVVNFLCQAKAKVLVTDLRSANQLKKSLLRLKQFSFEKVLGQHRREDFIKTDLIIKNPAVPNDSQYLKIAQRRRIPITTDINIFFELCPAPIIGISGTKGKSTVATLTAQILKQNYKNVVLAGNIGESVLNKLNNINDQSKVILELSSWQLNGLKYLKKSPHIALLTNILADHLNRYSSFNSYFADKKLIYSWQNAQDILVLNADADKLSQLSPKPKSIVYYYGKKAATLRKSRGAFLKNNKIYFQSKNKLVCEVSDLKILGSHNIENVLAAVTLACLSKVPIPKVKKALKKFRGVAGRLELVRVVGRVKFINDTTATMPDATIAALRVFPDNHIILICGGADKNLDFRQLAKEIGGKVKYLVLLKGTATDKIKKYSLQHNRDLRYTEVTSMPAAVAAACKNARARDIVLLSPACASFGLFVHEFDRGEQFNQVVRSL